MPKKQFKITDFSGGLNAYADARDILDTQFNQNWNASFDKYGVVRFTGAGVKYTTDHPHKNDNFVHGGGLFSFSTDISANVLDGTDLQKGFEKGIVGLYDRDSTPTSLTLAQTPTFNSQANHDTNDFYNNMILHIYDGPGKGQSSVITDYVGSTNVATVTTFGLSDLTGAIPDGSSSAAGIEGSTTENTFAVAKLRVNAEGDDTYHWGNTAIGSTFSHFQNATFLGSIHPWSTFGYWLTLGDVDAGDAVDARRFIDWVARGVHPFPVAQNAKKLVIKDRDGRVLSIIFVNAAVGRPGSGQEDFSKFPTATNAGATGVDNYSKVTQYQTSYSGAGISIPAWTAGDYIFSTDTYKDYYLLNCQQRKQGVSGDITDLDGDTSLATATTDGAHDLFSGDRILIDGTTSYDGVYKITKTAATTFTFPHASDNDNETGTFATVSAAENIAADIMDIINIENAASGINVSAGTSFDEDGNRTIVTLTAADAGEGTNSVGPQSLDVQYLSNGFTDILDVGGNIVEDIIDGDILGSGNKDAELEVFQNFTGGLGNQDSGTTNADGSTIGNLTKITSTGHSVKVGEYITLRGTYGTSGYDDVTFRVVWVEPNAIYIKTTLGDSTTNPGSSDSCTFTTVPDTTSRYIIYNITQSGWDFEDSYQGNSLMSNKSLTSKTTFIKKI